jgi:hypothetical protein
MGRSVQLSRREMRRQQATNNRQGCTKYPVVAPCWMFALLNSRCPCQGLSSACTFRRHIHEAVAADIGHAGERVVVWTFRAMSMPSRVSPADVPDNRQLSDGRVGRPGPPSRKQYGLGYGAAHWWMAMSRPPAVAMMVPLRTRPMPPPAGPVQGRAGCLRPAATPAPFRRPRQRCAHAGSSGAPCPRRRSPGARPAG